MTATMLQELCELGSNELIKMEYLHAEKWLEQAAALARKQNDLDTLSRVYMPLQEARRQRRLRCGEGIVNLNLVSHNSDDRIDGRRVVENFPHGQLLIAGWGCTTPATRVRELQKQYDLYVESFLAAVYPTTGGRTVLLVPLPGMKLPSPQERSVEELRSLLPAGCLVLSESDLIGPKPGDATTFAEVSSLWERLHLPLLKAADAMPDSIEKIAAYEQVIAVDYACELAHQNLSKTAHRLLRATPGA